MSTLSTVYEVKVAGHLDDHWSDWLGGLTITRHPDGTSTLIGYVADQAQLHGVLARLRDVGVELLALNAVEPAGHAEPNPPARFGRSARGNSHCGPPPPRTQT